MTRNTGVGRTRRLLVTASVLCLAVAAATTAAPGAEAAKKVLRVGVAAVGDPINPANNAGTNGQMLSIAYASILHENADGSIVPGLAVKWGFVRGNKNFEFTLRHDARFSDGTQVTAPAVVRWFNYYLTFKNADVGVFGPKPKFKAIGKWKVRITMTVPNPAVPGYLTQQSVNWSFVASPKAVANPDLFKRGTYGAGPYKLDYSKTVPGDHYTYVPNPYYYDKSKIRVGQIYVKVFAAQSSMLQALQAGQLDVMVGGDPGSAPVAEKSGFQVYSAPYATTFIQLNPHGSKPLADPRVRRAMNYALNRKAIANVLYGKYGFGTSQFLTTGDADPGLQNYYDYDPAKAKSLLAAAGYPNGFPFQLDILPQWEQIGGLVAHDLDAVGVKTKIVSFATGAAYTDALFKFKDDAWILGAGNGGSTPGAYGPFIGPTSAFRGGEPVDPQVDRLYFAGLRKNPVENWKKMWSIITKDAWFLPVATSDFIMFASKSVGGVELGKSRPTAYAIEWFFK